MIKDSRYLKIYLSLIVLAIGFAVALDVAKIDYRLVSADFHQYGDDTIVGVGNAMSRRERAALKVGFIEANAPPKAGVIGNHQIQYFAADSFAEHFASKDFFNYWYANLSLQEARDYIAFLNDQGKLPTELVIVSITTPNNDNGNVILDYRYELPSDISHYFDSGEESSRIMKLAGFYYDEARHYLTRFLDWKNLISNLIEFSNATGGRFLVFDSASCQQALNPGASQKPKLFGLLTVPDTFMEGVGTDLVRWRYCTGKQMQGYAFDGSSVYYDTRPLVQNEADIDDSEAFLHPGDDALIARYMRDIVSIAQTQQRRIVFHIPPVYEQTRSGKSDRIFGQALKMLQQDDDISIIDHRHQYNDQVMMFENYDHPSAAYFRQFVEDLNASGFLRR